MWAFTMQVGLGKTAQLRVARPVQVESAKAPLKQDEWRKGRAASRGLEQRVIQYACIPSKIVMYVRGKAYHNYVYLAKKRFIL